MNTSFVIECIVVPPEFSDHVITNSPVYSTNVT